MSGRLGDVFRTRFGVSELDCKTEKGKGQKGRRSTRHSSDSNRKRHNQFGSRQVHLRDSFVEYTNLINTSHSRFQLRTQFDRNVVTHFEAQEQVFDYIFSNLGIDTDGRVQHPIVLTEAFVNPNYCRQRTDIFNIFHVKISSIHTFSLQSCPSCCSNATVFHL